MRAKLLFALSLLPLIGKAQDSLQSSARAEAVKERFRAITGPDANYADSMAALRVKLNREIVLNRTLSDSIADLQTQLLLAEKKLLVRQYGAGKSPAYDIQQVRDFNENLFLQDYLAGQEGVQVFFPFNDSRANFGLYSGLTELAERSKREQLRIVISASSDSYGDEPANAKLAKERAEGARDYLVTVLGVNAERITIAPPESGKRIQDTELDFLNRRAVIQLAR